MSSTGRGPRLGGPEDHFATPSWAVRRRLDLGDLPGGLWLEPGAGDGAIIHAVNAVRSDVRWIAVEIREEAIAVLEKIPNVTVLRGDFLAGRFEVLASTPIEERQRDMPQTGRCPPCKGLGWFTADWVAVKKKDPRAERPCRGCLGFGKVKTGPSDVEKAWGLAA